MSFASMPLYTGDYLRDTRHLTPLKHGIYLLALMHCWDSQGPMPLDEQECAGICNCRSADEVEALRYVLSRYFVAMDDGHYNKRMADEVVKFSRLSRTFSEAGLKSAEVRRNKASAGKREQMEARTSEAERRLSLGSASDEPRSVSPSPSPSPSENKNKDIAPSALIAKTSDDPAGFAEFWSVWPASPRKQDRKKCAAKWLRSGYVKVLPAIVAHVEAMKPSEQWQDGFEPAPLTYLNGERWLDGMPAVSQSAAGFL